MKRLAFGIANTENVNKAYSRLPSVQLASYVVSMIDLTCRWFSQNKPDDETYRNDLWTHDYFFQHIFTKMADLRSRDADDNSSYLMWKIDTNGRIRLGDEMRALFLSWGFSPVSHEDTATMDDHPVSPVRKPNHFDFEIDSPEHCESFSTELKLDLQSLCISLMHWTHRNFSSTVHWSTKSHTSHGSHFWCSFDTSLQLGTFCLFHWSQTCLLSSIAWCPCQFPLLFHHHESYWVYNCPCRSRFAKYPPQSHNKHHRMSFSSDPYLSSLKMPVSSFLFDGISLDQTLFLIVSFHKVSTQLIHQYLYSQFGVSLSQLKQIFKILEKFRSNVNDGLTQMSDFALLLSSLNTYSGNLPVPSAHACPHNFFLVTAREVQLRALVSVAHYSILKSVSLPPCWLPTRAAALRTLRAWIKIPWRGFLTQSLIKRVGKSMSNVLKWNYDVKATRLHNLGKPSNVSSQMD